MIVSMPRACQWMGDALIDELTVEWNKRSASQNGHGNPSGSCRFVATQRCHSLVRQLWVAKTDNWSVRPDSVHPIHQYIRRLNSQPAQVRLSSPMSAIGQYCGISRFAGIPSRKTPRTIIMK